MADQEDPQYIDENMQEDQTDAKQLAEEPVPEEGNDSQEANDELALEEDAPENEAESEAANEGQEEEEAGQLVAPEEEEEMYAEGDVSERPVFIAESSRIDECAMTIIRGLSAMTNIEDEDVRANITAVFADIQAEEANLFSPMPDYIASIVEAEAQKRAKRNTGVQPHDDVARGESTRMSGNYDAEHRAYVDPSVPLALPYSLARDARENPNRNPSNGTYHNLFYGDGSHCVFEPPTDNKRVQLESERKSHQLPRHAPISYEPAPRRSLKVGPDFVPSCAGGTSPSQRDSENPAYRRSSGFALRSHKLASKADTRSRK